MEHEMTCGFLYRVLWGYNVPRLFFAMGLGFVCVYTLGGQFGRPKIKSLQYFLLSFRKSTPEGGNPAALRIPRP